MAIERLLSILSPPGYPLEASDLNWSDIERQIRTSLPDDYKAFIAAYGSGQINKFIRVFNPSSLRKTINLTYHITLDLEALKTLQYQFGEHCPYPLFPDTSGLLPFAGTDNGDIIYWLTEGLPNNWKIVVNESRAPDYEKFNLDMTLFLYLVLTGEINCRAFPSIVRGKPVFEPCC